MPNLQLPPYALILFVSAFINFGLGVYGLINRKEKNYSYISEFLLCCLAYGLLCTA